MLVRDMKCVPFADGHVLETVEQRRSHRRASGPASRVHAGGRHCLKRIAEGSDCRINVRDGNESRCAGQQVPGIGEAASPREAYAVSDDAVSKQVVVVKAG